MLSEAYAYGGIAMLPALVLHGFALVTLFAPTHEAGHATAFKSLWLGKAVAWVCGVITLNNADFYRRFHHWHQRRQPFLGIPRPPGPPVCLRDVGRAFPIVLPVLLQYPHTAPQCPAASPQWRASRVFPQ